MPKIKIIDGFVWAVLAPEEATEAFADNSVFMLYEDGSESNLETYAEFDEARNNEKRGFTNWLEDKAENLIN